MEPNPNHVGPSSDLEPPATTSRPSSRRSSAAPSHADGPAGESFEPIAPSISHRSRLSAAPLSRAGSAMAASESGTVGERPRRPSIRIRRSSIGQAMTPGIDAGDSRVPNTGRDVQSAGRSGNRPRSVSQPGSAPTGAGPARSRNSGRLPPQVSLPRLTEEGSRPTMEELGVSGAPLSPTVSLPMNTVQRSHSEDDIAGAAGGDGNRPARLSRVGRFFNPLKRSSGNASQQSASEADQEDEYNEELVDWLDIIDPEVQTLSTLTNVQNSLFIPDLGGWLNRRPTYVLSQSDLPPRPPSSAGRDSAQGPADARPSKEGEETIPEDKEGEAEADDSGGPKIRRSNTITSHLSESHYAALPHGRTLEGWTEEEKWELDDRVRHMLHSRRSKFKRQMKGFGQYVRRPLGFFVTLYATLITLFGLAWVLFLIGWIYVGSKQDYTIHIIDSVLVALFAVMGDGLAPFRAVDTYHTIFIVRYHRLMAKARKKRAAALAASGGNAAASSDSAFETREGQSAGKAVEKRTADEANAVARRPTDANTIPAIMVDGVGPPANLEDGTLGRDKELGPEYEGYDALTPKQRKSLEHHQKKLSKSHSFYKPYETYTHCAFPLGRLIAVIVLLDCHSCLQISLGATTWGIDYHHRPFAITTVILCVSITCNITAGLVIMFGDRATRKKDVKELLDRQALTGDAIKKVEHKREKKLERNTSKGSGSSGSDDGEGGSKIQTLNGSGSGSDDGQGGSKLRKLKPASETS